MPRLTFRLLFHPLLIQIRIITDDVMRADAERRCAQISARPHHLLQDRVPIIFGGIECLILHPPGDRHRFSRFQHRPGLVGIDPIFARVDDFRRDGFFRLKKLLSIGAARSTFTQVSPIDLHNHLLSVHHVSVILMITNLLVSADE